MADLNFLEHGKPGADGKKDAQEKKLKLFSLAEKKKRGVGVNLITTEAQKEATTAVIRKNSIQLGVSFLLSLGLALIVYGGLFLYGLRETGRVALLRQNLNNVEQDITILEKENKKLLGFQNKLTAIKSLFDEQRTLAPFFDGLEKNTLPEVAYETLTLSDDGAATLSAGTENYTTLARQLLAFDRAKEFVAKAQFSGITSSLDQLGTIIGVRFTVSLQLAPDVMKEKASAE